MRKLAAGNWKMNGTAADLTVIDALVDRVGAASDSGCEVVICPPATLLPLMGTQGIVTGGQDCHAEDAGAHTGDVSATMLADAGAAYVITGHSERRADHGETDAVVAAKTRAAWAAGLAAIVCVGETLAQREAGETLEIVEAQLAGSIPDGAAATTTVVAYEPVWAIGTGKVPTTDQIAEVHAAIRAHLKGRFADAGDMRLLYGGSVKAGNAAEIFAVPDVDGALVGGASLKAEDFAPIVEALSRA